MTERADRERKTRLGTNEAVLTCPGSRLGRGSLFCDRPPPTPPPPRGFTNKDRKAEQRELITLSSQEPAFKA